MVRATVERLEVVGIAGPRREVRRGRPAGYREVIRAWEEIGLFRLFK